MTYKYLFYGFEELDRDLDGLAVQFIDLDGEFGRIAERMARLARRYAPMRSGRLRRAIHVIKLGATSTVLVGGASMPYAGVINYGWPKRNIEASHFMERARAAVLPTINRTVTRRLDKMIRDRGMAA